MMRKKKRMNSRSLMNESDFPETDHTAAVVVLQELLQLAGHPAESVPLLPCS